MDWGLDDYWLKVAMEKAGEIYGSPMCADALRADASARRDIILHERANSLAEQLKCSEEAAHAAATAAYFASPDVIIAEFTGDKSSGQWPPKKLTDPKVVKQAIIDALELPEKKILALQFSTSAYFATTIRGYPTRSADKIRLKPTPHAQSRSLSLIPAFIMLTRLVFCLFSPADFFMGLRLWRFSDLAERCEEFTFVYPARGEGTKETAQLALYEQYARMFGFETPDGKLPVALLNERKRQRGETDVEDAAVEPPPKMDVFAYMEKAARLAPQGAKYLKLPDGGGSLAAAALAGAVVPVVAPWRRCRRAGRGCLLRGACPQRATWWLQWMLPTQPPRSKRLSPLKKRAIARPTFHVGWALPLSSRPRGWAVPFSRNEVFSPRSGEQFL